MKKLTKICLIVGASSFMLSYFSFNSLSIDELTVSANTNETVKDCEKQQNKDCASTNGTIYIGHSKKTSDVDEPQPWPDGNL
ncbi:hypothetical protein MUB18_04135 [Sphingobacterium sp. PCS056]|uniref:hypothetical protein n=1 Tax=Sphingobacterium sp. PCS056 TaxID=2931400 RepID=UPI00200BD539|nr:hypothetical protein [Sphingobacterium sp. PCS056]UPZ37501.1 hypothetical protein MUB18_04135 [Sphingobacterium sp. PCS056]UZJ65087.1 hypothetical protein OKW96_02045 [Sphingobacterium sp. KU25419]